jgi:hypothetical protein
MIIKIDTDLINEHKLTPTYYCILYFIHKGLSYQISPQTEQALQKLEMLDSNCHLTDKAKSLFPLEVAKIEKTTEEISALLEEMRKIYPDGVKTGGKYVKSSFNAALLRKFRGFLSEYTYSDEIILSATRSYVEDRKKDGYKFMKVFTYFIDKQGEDSTLAAYCEQVVNGTDKTENKSINDYNIKLD